MIEYVMRYDIDDAGKFINARRQEELVRCRDCKFLFTDSGCPLRTFRTHKLDDFCSYGESKNMVHYCNNCKHKNVSWREPPCDECISKNDKWEKEE